MTIIGKYFRGRLEMKGERANEGLFAHLFSVFLPSQAFMTPREGKPRLARVSHALSPLFLLKNMLSIQNRCLWGFSVFQHLKGFSFP